MKGHTSILALQLKYMWEFTRDTLKGMVKIS